MRIDIDKEECVIYTSNKMEGCPGVNELFMTCDEFKDKKLLFDRSDVGDHVYRCEECKNKGNNLVISIG